MNTTIRQLTALVPHSQFIRLVCEVSKANIKQFYECLNNKTKIKEKKIKIKQLVKLFHFSGGYNCNKTKVKLF